MKITTVVTLIAGLLFSLSAQAGCWTGKVQCLVMTPAGKHAGMQQCQAFSCANVHNASSGWSYPDGTEIFSGYNIKTHDNPMTINQQPAQPVLDTKLDKKGYTCFTLTGKHYYCSIDLPH